MQLRGRLTGAQRRALNDLLPRFLAPFDAPLDQAGVFGRQAPLGVEIGFGTGDALLHWSERRPDWNLLGIEIYPPGIGALLNRIEAEAVSNIRIAQGRAEEVIEQALLPSSVAEFRIFFPDPWPKKRHHKRRLIQPEFVDRLLDRLLPGGTVHFATDWAPYAEWAEAVFGSQPALIRREPLQSDELRPVTRFERRGQRLGHHIFEYRYTRST